MAVVATGNYSLREKYLADTLSACAAFQSMVGAANATEALARVYFDVLPDPDDGDNYTLEELENYRPFALIYTESDNSRADSSGFGYSHFATLDIILERATPTGLDKSDADLDWKNVLGTILDEMRQLCGKSGYLAATSIGRKQGEYPSRSHPSIWKTQGDFQTAVISVSIEE